MTYAKNKNAGQWRAHGRYIARDTATQAGDPFRAGFDATRTDINIASVLDRWQHAGDDLIFKMIVSPEFGDRLNLQDQARKLIQRIEKDLDTRLEWVAAAHFNTEHPHVHIALRGRDQTGSPLRLPRYYIRSGIRFHAENLATEALGFRTERDAEEAHRREVTQNLEKMGLARSLAPQQWRVQSDFETVLRTLQLSGDRQKMLAAHGALSSDTRLPFEIANIRKLKIVEGRVLLHAEDETSGRRYLLLEGTDAKVHLIYHTDSIEEARRAGKLAVNSFVRLEKRFAERTPHIEISDHGDANALLENRVFFKKQAQSSLRRGILEDQNTWGGWLGQYYARLRAATETEKAPARTQKAGQQR